MTDVVLGKNQYGKAENHVVRIDRDTDRHVIRDLVVTSQLRGDFSMRCTRRATTATARPRTPRRTPCSRSCRSTGGLPRCCCSASRSIHVRVRSGLRRPVGRGRARVGPYQRP
ncbi:hypothetical protein QJS66_10675 [Kocuria rhizophila]|nr:hypothetical protein QJS66_10675 [Kocuria rhizophila]